MAAKRKVRNGGELVLEAARVVEAERIMLSMAFQNPKLEPVMTRVARVLGLPTVEKEIARLRKYASRRNHAA